MGDPGSIPGLGRSPGEGNGSPLQYSCLENPMDRGAWQATYSPWGRKESDMTERLHFHLLSLFHIVYGCLLGVLFSYPLETFHIDEFMMFPSAAAVREKCLFTLRR